MITMLKKSLIAANLALVALSLCAARTAFAQEEGTETATSAAVVPPATEEDTDDGQDPDTPGATVTDYNCELGAKVTTYHNMNDDSFMAVRWKQRIHLLRKIGTTNGVRRFEDTTFGLTWIGIPSKAILLDSKLHRQLANECMNADQEKEHQHSPADLQTSEAQEVIE